VVTQVKASANRRKRIVIVEDDIFVLAFLTSVLRSAEYEVMAASDGRSALATFDQIKGEIDLLLTDFRLPDTDGYRLARDLLQKYPKLKVICMSAACLPSSTSRLASQNWDCSLLRSHSLIPS
jgi:CheY-like chemotaxis protein